MRWPRVRLHLLTCVVLMFVAGGFIWLNLRERFTLDGEGYYELGWPCTILTKTLRIDVIPTPSGPHEYTYSEPRWTYATTNFVNTAINIGVATLAMLLVTWLVEHLLDRSSKNSFPPRTAGK